jgi:DNA-binding transcriptional MerR regulator
VDSITILTVKEADLRISELSAATGVSVATLKYYLREGLLPAGAAVTARSASYDDSHVGRVRLIRALVESAGLPIADVRKVTAALDEPPESWHELLGRAQYALRAGGAQASAAPADEASPWAHGLVAALGWHVSDEAPALRELETALEAASSAGLDLPAEDLTAFASAMREVAEVDVARVPGHSPEAALRRVVLGTVLVDPVLLALRRLAQEDVSSRSLPPA